MKPIPAGYLTHDPITVQSLRTQLYTLGVRPSMTLLVHSSLKAVAQDGWVCGGPTAIVLALQETVTTDGTLIMPTHSSNLSDPTHWENPPVPKHWHQIIRDEMPAFRPDITITRQMGQIVDTFRQSDGVIRSYHPTYSFAAWGKDAELITADHTFAHGMGEQSPLGRVYDLAGHVLLIGVGHGNNSSLHLAEYRAEWPGKAVVNEQAPVLIAGKRVWETFPNVDLDSDDFETIGAAFEAETQAAHSVTSGKVGLAQSRLMSQPALVDFAVDWMGQHRTEQND